MIDLTVAICTYNGETRLPNVLDRLLSQIKIDRLAWEVIIIDNNSRDRTAEIVQQYQRFWPEAYPIRYYFEAQPGLAFARRLAVKRAQGWLVGFLDDDNLPSGNWVATVYSFGQGHPKAGAYGSQIEADYEVKPPENFDQIACFLGAIDRGQEPFRYDLLQRWLFPAGAGLAIRKQAWLESVSEKPILTGVAGTSLSAKGEDIETLSYLRKKGWEIWHNPEMKITHQIPKERLEKTYLITLFRGVGLSRYQTRMLQFPIWKAPFMLLLYLVNDLRKLIFHYFIYRQVIKTDLVAMCQLELLIYSLLSPLYHWQKRLISINCLAWLNQLKNQ
jgi:glycosyltransferase involved in cell wall biosynthesis